MEPLTLPKIDSTKFYATWEGHTVEDLEKFKAITSEARPNKPIIYLAGDSSLDNKYWVKETGQFKDVKTPDVYVKALENADPKPDVAFWLNHLLGDSATCINGAIEESMLRQRNSKLRDQDAFIRDNITSDDILIISVGNNDVAMKPLPTTIFHMLKLAWFAKRADLESGSASSLSYFRHLFGHNLEKYIEAMTCEAKPRAVVVCMIYYPLEAGKGQKGWANLQLKALGYDTWPERLQAAIRAMYESATKTIKVEGTEIIPCPIFEILDGKNAADYAERVEPSEEGGRKMAEQFMRLLEGRLGDLLGGISGVTRSDEAGSAAA